MPVAAATLTAVAAAVADGLAEGALTALMRDPERIPALAEALARGWVRGLQSLTTKSDEDAKPDPALQGTLNDSLAEAIKEGKVPG